MVKAYLSIITKAASPVQLKILIEKLRKTKGVVVADSVSGEFNAIVVVDALDGDALNKMVTKLSKDNPIIEKIATSVASSGSPSGEIC